MKVNEPLVSVGIPTYNRPEGLRQTLECITSQTYRNIEIIISDNASPNSEVKRVAEEFTLKDKRIQYYQQDENKGAIFNFKFVLYKAHGEYFMWAADDDEWENFYIEKLVHLLELPAMKEFVAANFEAQYIDEHGNPLVFFSEGTPFYNYEADSSFERLQYMLKHNYGNIIYSIYRREALKKDGLIFAQNEIPFLLYITQQGNWRVLPEIGFYKRTTLGTYTQAQWEIKGGYLDSFTKSSLFKRIQQSLPVVVQIFKYHRNAIYFTFKVIDNLNISPQERIQIKNFASTLSWKHFFQLLFRYKKKR